MTMTAKRLRIIKADGPGKSNMTFEEWHEIFELALRGYVGPSDVSRHDLESRNFYELCQEYRHFQGDAIVQFENIKTYLYTGKLPWPSYDDPTSPSNSARQSDTPRQEEGK